MQSGEVAAWGQFSPLQRGNLEAQRGWMGWLRLPSWLQREPGLRRAPPPSCPLVLSSCSVTMASASCGSPSISVFRALILFHFSPLNVQSNLDTICILLCDHRKATLLLWASVPTSVGWMWTQCPSRLLVVRNAKQGITLWAAERFRERKWPSLSSDSVGLLRAPSLEMQSFTCGAK